jgi:hypothetical protein
MVRFFEWMYRVSEGKEMRVRFVRRPGRCTCLLPAATRRPPRSRVATEAADSKFLARRGRQPDGVATLALLWIPVLPIGYSQVGYPILIRDRAARQPW